MRPTNKFERRQILKNKFKNRIQKNFGEKEYEKFLNNELENTNLYCYKTMSTDCSCYMCSGEKYKRILEQRRIKEEMDNLE